MKYKSGGASFIRECFASHNPSVIAEKITADKNGALNTEISFSASHETDSIRVQDNSLILCGRLSDNDLAYYARLCVTTDGETVKGTVSSSLKTLRILFLPSLPEQTIKTNIRITEANCPKAK